MAKKISKKRRTQPQQKQTNWLLIGGVVGIGVIGLFALLFLSLQGPAAPELLDLEEYCRDNPNNCMAAGVEDAPVTIVAIGLSLAQYVVATGTITSSGLTASLVAALERNYSNP